LRAIQVTEFGGPEVLELVELPDPHPTDDQLLVQVTAAGVNYADTHQAENTYLAAQQLPLVPGAEVVGRTADGRRVLALLGTGGYAQRALASPSGTFDVPDAVDDGQALALGVQGLTAWHLLRTCARLADGESVVVVAAAGGVGSLAVQLARRWGAGRVIALASSPEKRDLALRLGAHVAVDSRHPDLKAAIEEANGGRKVDVVLEMAGGPVFAAALAALAPFGRMVTYGMAARQPTEPVDPRMLLSRSRAVIGFWLAHCFARPQMLAGPMAQLMGMVVDGTLQPVVHGTYPLSQARQAHLDLRSRATTGKLVLDPSA